MKQRRLEPFEADDGTVPIERLFKELSEFQRAAHGAALRVVLAGRGIDLADIGVGGAVTLRSWRARR